MIRGRLTAGVVAASLAVAGCTAEPPVSPLPIEAATTSAVPSLPATTMPASISPTASPPTSPPTSPSASRRPAVASRTGGTATSSPRPSRTPASPSTLPSSCQGAVVYTIDVATDELALARGLCLAVGAVLRIEHIGPGEVTTDSPDLVDQHYEAGVVEIRFVRPGTVVVTIPQNGRPYRVTVVVR